jgi:hypothetical protein
MNLGQKVFLMGWLFLASSLSSQTLVQDSTALVDLYNNTGGASWANNTNWLSGPVSSWFGVTVSAGRVAVLNLSNNGLSGPIPSSVGGLTALTSLQLFGNQLSGSVPTQLGDLTNLTSLGLEQNQLSGTIPSSLGNLSILVELTLSGNQLTDSVPTTFVNLSNLQTLNIQSNRMDQFPDLSGLSALATLNISNNRFTFEDIEPNVGVPSSSFTYAPQDSVGSYETRVLTEGSSTTLTVTVGGTSNTYQWLKNGNAISGATSAALTFSSLVAPDSGVYSCSIGNTLATALTLHSRTVKLVITGSTPGAPGNLTATAASGSRVDLAWTAGSGVVNRYRIQRSFSPSTGFSQIDSVVGTSTTYANLGLTPGTTYYYRVFAVGSFGTSPASNVDSATTFGTPPVVVAAIPDTTFNEGFGKRFIRRLRDVFSDLDTPSLSFSATSNPAEIVVSGPPATDTLYVTEVPGFLGVTEVRVTATDGISSVTDTFLVTVNPDSVPPVISSVQSNSPVAENTIVTVTCQATDNYSVSSVQLSYRAGAGAFQTTPMALVSGNTYSADIPAASVTLEGVSFFVSATDNRNNVGFSDTAGIRVTFSQLSSATLAGSEYASGISRDRWRLISVPADLSDKTVAALFPNTNSQDFTAFTYAGGSFSTTNAISPGRAVWFRHKSNNDTLPIRCGGGTTNDGAEFSITLTSGWNLIGNPYPFPLAVNLPQDTVYGPISYTGSSTDITGWTAVLGTINPFGGYAVYNRLSTSRTLYFRPVGAALSKQPQVRAEATFVLRIEGTGMRRTERFGDLYNYFTLTPEVDAGRFNAPEPHSVDDHVSVFFEQDGSRLSSLYESSTVEDRAVDVFVTSSMDGGEVDLSFMIEKNTNGLEMAMVNVSENMLVAPSGVVTLRHTRQGPVRLRLLIGRRSFVDQALAEVLQGLPRSFELLQNHPNPFNPYTEIRYALAKQGRVTLTVHNVLGQEIRRLVDNKLQETGFRSVRWDGRDNRQRTVASGVYIYRLSVRTLDGQHVHLSKRMSFIK